MCICERTEASQTKSGRNTANRRSPLAKKGRPRTHTMQSPPPRRRAPRATSTTVAVRRQPSKTVVPCRSSTAITPATPRPQQPQHLSLQQLSSILDPFYDTCSSALRQQRKRLAARQATAARPTPPAAGEPTTSSCCQLAPTAVVVEHSFLSQVGESKANQSGRSSSVNCGAIQDFMSVGNSAWMNMIQDMEAEKHEQLRSLDVSIAY